MQRFEKKLLMLLMISYCSNSFSQNNLNQKPTMIGSDKYISNHCKDSCVIEYDNYTVITKDHKKSCGEYIIVVCKKEKRKLSINVKDDYKAQYFNGIHGDKIIVDVGTGTVRRNFIFDLKQGEIIDTIDNILDDSRILDDKLYYMSSMSAEKVKALKLPICENLNLEISGYFEEYYYDFKTRKIVLTGKYQCLK